MREVFRTAPLPTKAEGGVVVVHCSDPRYQPHFQDFLRRGLGLERYALIAVPGGAQLLTLTEYLPKFSWAGWRWVKFMVGVARPERIILIAHDDCLWYLDGRFGLTRAGLRQHQQKDLERVRAELGEQFGRARVELYYARLENGQGTFDAV